MEKLLIAAIAGGALALSAGAALAGGNPAIANDTNTSVTTPLGSPGYKAPRSEAVPGLPAQARNAQERTEARRGTENDAKADQRSTQTTR